MGPIEITVIVLVAAFVLAMIIAMTVRKLKGKPSLGSDCGCCPYGGNCNGACKGKDGKEDVSDIVAEVKARQAEARASQEKDPSAGGDIDK